MVGLADLVILAKQFGIFEFYLPFLILFSLFYGLLGKIKIFGDPFKKDSEAKMAKTINLIFSLAAALFLMAYTPVGITLTQFFATSFTQTTVIITTLISAAIIVYLLATIAGVSFTEKDDKGKDVPVLRNYLKIIVVVGALVAIGVFISSGGLSIFPGLAGVDTGLSGIGLSTQDVLIIGLIVITALAMYWVVHEPKTQSS